MVHYVTGYTGYSDDPDEQNGYYLALHITSPGNDNIKVRLNTVNHESGEEDHVDGTLDSDGIVVVRRESLSDMSQSIDIMVYDNDDRLIVAKTYALDLHLYNPQT